MDPMKTVTIAGQQFEIVDGQARETLTQMQEDVRTLQGNIEKVQQDIGTLQENVETAISEIYTKLNGNVTILRAGNIGLTQKGASFKTFLEGNHKTNTGRFLMIGRGVLQTSRNTSSIAVMVNGLSYGTAGTNLTTPITVNPVGTYNGTAGTTYTVGLAVYAQDGETTATIPHYNAASLICIDF